ncbi:hypothetical protein Tco_0490198 [Tanacetum coccineum]
MIITKEIPVPGHFIDHKYPYTVNVYQPMPSHVQNGHINNCFNISQDSRQCFDYCLVFPTSFGGFLHLASSMQLAVVVLVDALGPELVLEFAPVESGLSQFLTAFSKFLASFSSFLIFK